VIGASYDDLQRQAPLTANIYLRSAVDCLDEQFGDGYAAKNPYLVGAIITAATQDFCTAVHCIAIQEAVSAIMCKAQELLEEYMLSKEKN
jgi:hypothetical protein